jgi:NitT/TauT family transport system substrate-binding protein
VSKGWGNMRLILSPAAWAGVFALAALCAHAGELTPIRVGYTNTVSFTGLFIAKDQGLFAKRGLDVNLVLLALNSTIPAALVGGSVQIGGTNAPVLLQAVGGGLDIVIVAGCAVNDIRNKDGAGVVARTGVQIKTAKDFEGKRVGVPGIGAYMHLLFRRWLVEHGANDKKVNFVEVPFAQASDILKSGNVDAILLGDPFYSRVIKARTGYLVAPYLTEMPDGLFSIYYSATREWAKSNAPAIKAFRDALAEANVFLAHDPDKSRQILAKATRLPPDVVASVMLPTLKLTVPESDVNYWSDTLLAQGVLRARPDAAKLVIH